MKTDMNIETLCVHSGKDKRNDTGAIAVPIYQSATYAHPAIGESTGFDYSRVHNPTRQCLEELIAQLEGGKHALAFSTGMAAIGTIMELFSPGDHIITSANLYGGTSRLFDAVSRKNGIRIDRIDMSDLRILRDRITAHTKAVFIETPTNPLMRVTDIAAVRDIIGQEMLLIVDNTFLTPYFQKPLALGADIVVHSGTKYLGGHNDTLAGFIVTSNDMLIERLRYLYKTIGACLSPFDSFLIIRGIKTLALRMEKSQQNAKEITQWLCAHPRVRAVYYPGLPDHPDYAISKKQASGFGAMIAFEVDNEETVKAVLKRLKIILYAESLGGVETLITYPVLQTHADLPKETRDELGINHRLLRLSVGIESAGDLIADLAQAFSSE